VEGGHGGDDRDRPRQLGLAFGGDWARRVVPAAALLGSIAAVSILLIAFLPMLKILPTRWSGWSRCSSCCWLSSAGTDAVRAPGAFASVLAGTLIFWGRAWLDLGPGSAIAVGPLRRALPWPTLGWLDALPKRCVSVDRAPFALVTIIGGIDNTESAAAAGDEYRARDILLTKPRRRPGRMLRRRHPEHALHRPPGVQGDGRARRVHVGDGARDRRRRGGRTLSLLVAVLPEAAIAPILVFIGLEITAQGFLATPPRYGAASPSRSCRWPRRWCSSNREASSRRSAPRRPRSRGTRARATRRCSSWETGSS